ncbi:hypothetical protein BBBOND_0403080 [Babesia bigemina]|uniref:Uncharacterized protein n=1 Tax=Babesia bigemina TaxID=5866 RepID=A0A061DET1_BABBI|nr:hypothetical protein BBBOND_0403080 [Babesia bigemina]CDR97820.1 hypothetical protein BBBOND_0403080 [Babesia bigemina]|eukprot:XP_012770006.1 hypothetical protein BBBOND_0403080 [Babesia bigemina]
MGAEMRAALYEKRVPAQTITEWYPYLTAHTRFFFRRQLKWMNDTGQFNYYKHRRYDAHGLDRSVQQQLAKVNSKSKL